MKIVHVVSNFSGAVGAGRDSVSVLATATSRLGHAVTVVSASDPAAGGLGAELRDANVTVHELGASDPVRAALKLARLLERLRPDVVHVHADALPTAWVASRILSPLRGPRIVHTLDERALTAVSQAPRALRAAVWARAEQVAVSEAAAAGLERAFGARPRHIIPTAIPVAAYRMSEEDRASERAALGLRRNQVAFLTVVDRAREHDPALILDAFARPGMGPARLLIADAGTLRRPLEVQARALDVLGRVDFLDDGAPLPRILGAADALVVAAASPCSVVKQAMAAGLPVIAAQNAPWVSDATGLGFPAGDAAALSGAMKRLAQDRTLGRRLGLAGATVALEQFDACAVAQRYEKVYAATCGKTR